MFSGSVAELHLNANYYKLWGNLVPRYHLKYQHIQFASVALFLIFWVGLGVQAI